MYNRYRSVIGFRNKSNILCRIRLLSMSHHDSLSRNEAADILGIRINASKKEVKQAYLQKAKIFHPDNKVRLQCSYSPLVSRL